MFRERSAEPPPTAPAAAAVFTTLLTEGPLSRIGLSRRLELSPAAVTKAVRPLIEVGYLYEIDATERSGRGVGRPANQLAVRADREFLVGVKITADELVGVVTDLCAEVRETARRPLTARRPGDVLADLADLVRSLLDRSPRYRSNTRRLGLAVSGDVDRGTGLVRYSPFLDWRGVPLGERAAAVTGLTVTVENDVKALTIAEHWFGEGVGADPFALVTVGAGIGCGLVVHGRPVSGAYGVAGELGHVPVDPAGPACHCGGRGCVEAIAGTAAIVREVGDLSGRAGVTIADAVALARDGDDKVRAVFARAGEAIGLGIAAVANLVGPERIVVSGEGLAASDLFETHVRAAFAAQAFGAAGRCTLSVRPLPFEEWARGAAAVGIKAMVAA